MLLEITWVHSYENFFKAVNVTYWVYFKKGFDNSEHVIFTDMVTNATWSSYYSQSSWKEEGK